MAQVPGEAGPVVAARVPDAVAPHPVRLLAHERAQVGEVGIEVAVEAAREDQVLRLPRVGPHGRSHECGLGDDDPAGEVGAGHLGERAPGAVGSPPTALASPGEPIGPAPRGPGQGSFAAGLSSVAG